MVNSQHHHDHDHDHTDPPSELALRVRALESLLVEKGLVDPAALDALIDTYETRIGPRNGAKVVVRVIDGNDRQIDNGKTTGPDRQQVIAGVVDKPLEGQMLRLDVVSVKAR